MKKILLLLTLGITLLSATSAQNGADTRKKQFNLSKNNLAIEGYDPVAYFIDNKAIEGKKELAVSYEGLTYYFSSEKNKDLFKQSPSKYEPQYGGWCAYAMGATGEKVAVDPETFKVLNGKLYLFYNKFFNNTLKTWNKDEASLKQKADASWMKFYH
jgi:YHS domain-containing protein